MRPRKKVLLYCLDEQLASERKLQLKLWGYTGVRFRSLPMLVTSLRCECFHMVLAVAHEGIEEFAACFEEIAEIQSARSDRALLCTEKVALCEDFALGINRVQPLCAAELRERLKVMMARKCGPRTQNRVAA